MTAIPKPAWQSPKITVIPVGLEINAYASATVRRPQGR
ncbi:MAG TPA: pyrroloquinoline quinone precursor peptide PqqA [Kiloniellales bacterium]|nr:pyrroloquinoline quinone precursor peptide PqqA [Kiloniellales bacterium]